MPFQANVFFHHGVFWAMERPSQRPWYGQKLSGMIVRKRRGKMAWEMPAKQGIHTRPFDQAVARLAQGEWCAGFFGTVWK